VTLQRKRNFIIFKMSNLAPVYRQHEGDICYPELIRGFSFRF